MSKDRFDLAKFSVAVSLPLDRNDDDYNQTLYSCVAKKFMEHMLDLKDELRREEDRAFDIDISF